MGARRFALVQHVAAEGPGTIGPIAERHGLILERFRMDRGDALPAAREVGGVVVLGGPMGTYQAPAHPHLAAEQALLAEACACGLPVLGICLGAQLLAAALGARVYRGPTAEMGAGVVTLTAAGARDPVLGPAGEAFQVLHWHGDTFDLPDGATLLASSSGYAHQAFRSGTRAYGFQFHPEVDRDLARAWAPVFPAGIALTERDRVAVEATGRAILDRFFAAALAASGERSTSEGTPPPLSPAPR
jgi:GMP synthase-like glutamine amidotransferase